MQKERTRGGVAATPWVLVWLLPTAVWPQPAQPDELPGPAAQGPALEAPASEADVEENEQAGEAGETDGEGNLRIYDQIEVRERVDDQIGIADSSSEGSTGSGALRVRPIQRAGEVVETVPGLIATQHSGDGKANQYFLRGFNLDHGTDFAIAVAGVPVNMPSHGHGQGYADLNFVIPELIERVHFRKGPASAHAGDFSAAGSARVDLVPRLERGFLHLAIGGQGFRRALAGGSTFLGDGSLTAAVELHGNDGSWERPNEYERFNGLVRYYAGDAARGWSLTAMGYDGSWLSTDQVPERAVEQGLIGRYGLIDPTPRGETGRYSLSASVRRGDERSLTRAEAYALHYDFTLFSNFTYFLDDPDRGDEFEQRDERWVGGFDMSHVRSTRLGNRPAEWTLGWQARYDDIENGLFRTRDLERFATTRHDRIELLTSGLYGETTLHLHETFRTTLGLRYDYLDARVASDLPLNSGSIDDSLLSPKVSVAWRFRSDTELYGSFGYGFHSNDARGATIRVDPVTGEAAEPVDPLVRATGAEIGLRTAVLPDLQSTLTVYSLELDSELVFLGDGGATEASRPSRRVGVEWTNAWRPRAWLTMDLDVAWVDSGFTDDDPAGDEIPGALKSVVTGGVSVDLDPWSGALRLRTFSGYPLIEDGSVRAGSTVVLNGRIARTFFRGWQLFLEGFNLLDRDDNDIEYLYVSRLPGEPEAGVEDLHFHPIEKPALRLGVSRIF